MGNQSNENLCAVKEIIKAIAEGDMTKLQKALAEHPTKVDAMDEHGMTPLQHAAYKGNKEMVQLLFDLGADVHAGAHEYYYTALHFAALSGNSEVCRLLMDAGAEPYKLNSMGRTAGQMAAFVGNHQTVVTINSYVGRNEIAFFAEKQDDKAEPPLLPYLVDPLHKLVLGVNINPVRIALNVQNIPGLYDNALMCGKVLDMFCKKEMTRLGDQNEVLAFKYHYLAYILKEIHNAKEKQKPGSEQEDKQLVIEMFCKRLLKPGKDGESLDIMDMMLKDCVREFPFRECTIFHQMVSSLTSPDPPSALSVIDRSLHGLRAFADFTPICSTCGEEKPGKKCSKCKAVEYCNRDCQRLHWFVHKKSCSRESTAASSAPTTPTTRVIDANELSAELQNLVAGGN